MKYWMYLGIMGVFFGNIRDSWAEEYIDMCPCLPVNMCRGVFRASHEDEMYFSRILQCSDETHTRCCSFSVTVTAQKTTNNKESQETDIATTEIAVSTTDSAADATDENSTEELITEEARFDRDLTTETPTATVENRENIDGVLLIYPTEVSKNMSSHRLMRAFEGNQPEDELVLVFPQETSRETRATTSEDGPSLTTPEIPKQINRYKYNNSNRKRFMPILKINETQTEASHILDGKPIFKVTNSDNRRFLEELYRNRTRFGTPASQITTSTTPRESEILKNEIIPETYVTGKPNQMPGNFSKRNLYYDPSKRKSFFKKNGTNEIEGLSVNNLQNFNTKQIVDNNHRDMIEEVLSELKKESNTLVIPQEVAVSPAIAAKISNMQKRLIEKIVDKISTKIERREDFEEITATTKREQTRPFRGSLRYVDTLRNVRASSGDSMSSGKRDQFQAQEPGNVHQPKEPLIEPKRYRKNLRKKTTEDHTENFTGDTSLPIDFRPSPLWTLQRGDDPYPIPQVPLQGGTRESRDIMPDQDQSWRLRGFVPIPQIPRTTPIEIIGPIPKRFTHNSSKHSSKTPSDLPSENVPLHFRRFTGKVFSRK